MASHRHLIVDVTLTSACTNTNVPRLLLPGSLVLGAHHGKLDADIRTSALRVTPSVQSVHEYYPFALEDRGRLAPMATDLVVRPSILVGFRCFLDMGVFDSRSLRFDNYVRIQQFIHRTK
jgi:hypothetical protein